MLYVFDPSENLIALLKPEFTRSSGPASTSQAFLSAEYPAELDREPTEGCPYWDARHREVLNGENTFSFTVPGGQADAAYVTEGNLVAFKDLDSYWQFFEIKRLVDLHSDGLTRTAFCEHIFYELLDDIVTDKRPSADATSALAGMLENTRWQVGIVDDLGASSTSAYYESALSAVQKVANAWKGELNWRCVISGGTITRYVDLKAMRGTDTGKQFAYTKDIISIEREVDSSNVVTALYGRGKGIELDSGSYGRRLTFADIEAPDKPAGQEWLGDADALARWGRPGGRHRFGVFIDEEETDPEKLLEKTRAELARRKVPRVTYRLDVVSLEQLTGYEHEQVRLGDLVRVIDREFRPELVVSARVIEIERDLLAPENTKVVLGSFAPTIVEATINTARRVEEIANKPYNTKWLDGVIDVLQNAIENSQAYIWETPQGTLHMDAPTYEQATSAMLLGGGRFAIANQKDGNGGWNWRTFGDGSGFTADLLNAGKIKSSLIEVGPESTFAEGYDPSQIQGGAAMGVDDRCTALFHFDGSLNSHKGLTPTFTRNSVAYTIDGKQVASGVPRFEQGKFGQGVFIEEGTTNLISSSQGGIGTDLTKWAQSWGVTATKEGEWYRLTNTQVATAFMRGTVDLPKLTNGAIYTCSLELYNDGVSSVTVFLDWCDIAGASLSVMPGERKIIKVTASRAEYTSVYRFMDINVQGSRNILARFPQVERKDYVTSFIEGIRVNESLTIPKTATGFDPQKGTFSFWFNPLAKTPQAYPSLFSMGHVSGEDFIGVYWGSGWDNADSILFGLRNKGVGWLDQAIPFSVEPYTWYYIVFRWDFVTDKKCKMIVYKPDGGKMELEQPLVSFSAPSFSNFDKFHVLETWSNGASKANALMDELAIFNYAATDEEIAGWYKAQAPFYSSEDMKQWPGYIRAESDGIKVYGSENALRVLLGSWLKDAVRKYGLKIIGGEIYSSLIRTGLEGDAQYIAFEPPNVLAMYAPKTIGSNIPAKVLEMASPNFADSAGIDWFDTEGTWYAQVLAQTADRKLHLYGKNGVSARNGFSVTGGTKNCIEDTIYGSLAISARESPEVRYIDEGMGQLTNGECRVLVDPIFMECIEPHTEYSRWYVHLTPYADVDLYVSEIGTDYFVVKERNNGISTGAEFTWSLSATRKDYAHIRFMEVL
ncbi:phage tail spike protein [Syntrophomonas erecta subsp. sporosyntropha]